MTCVQAIILAGGKGERLWPLSRAKKPKQLLPFTHGKSLLEYTITRLLEFIKSDDIAVLTNQEQYDQTVSAIGAHVHQVIAEPVARNTAPAIALMVLEAMQKNPETMLLFLPADHAIQNVGHYVSSLKKALAYAAHNQRIMLVGVKPHTAATGYGYIECSPIVDEVADVIAFHEKPNLTNAEQYLTRPDMLWNAGIFCGRASVFFDLFSRHAPHILLAVEKYRAGDCAAYETAESISIDYAILEKTNQLGVVQGDFGWSDVGNLETFLSHYVPDTQQEIISVDSYNNLLVSSKKVVALIGVDNVCVVEHDDALLIVSRSQVEQVKKVVARLKEVAGDTYS